MNITEYFSEEDRNPPVYRGKMSLKENYTIADADESLYKYIGDNSALPITSLIHPDDVDSFREALDRLGEETQRVIARLQCNDGSYRYMYMVLYYNGRVIDGFKSVDMDVLDIMRIHYKFDMDHDRLLKYRRMMSFDDKLYFEYHYQDGEITIFRYVNDRSLVLFREDIYELERHITEDAGFSERQRTEFQILRERLAAAQENMELEVDGALFGLDGKYLRLKGGLFFRESPKKMMTAVVTVRNDVEEDEKYYMSPNAFDNATGVYNKRAITELARDLLAEGGENPRFVCVADIDDFKGFNDTFGHMVGDEIISKVAETFRSVLGQRGYVGRFGGDEFLIVTDRVRTSDELVYILKAIRKHIAWSCSIKLGGMALTTSIGIACYPEHGTTFEELFNIADKCLYIAKNRGRNRFVIYTPELHGRFEVPNVSGGNVPTFTKNSYESDYKVLTDMIARVGDDNPEDFNECLKKICKNYRVDGITIYTGEKYERKYSVGDCHGIESGAEFVEDPRMQGFFDGNGVCALNKIISIKEELPDIHEILEERKISGCIYVKVARANGFKALVAFDVLVQRRKWSENDKGLLLIASGTIVDWYLRLADKLEKMV